MKLGGAEVRSLWPSHVDVFVLLANMRPFIPVQRLLLLTSPYPWPSLLIYSTEDSSQGQAQALSHYLPLSSSLPRFIVLLEMLF